MNKPPMDRSEMLSLDERIDVRGEKAEQDGEHVAHDGFGARGTLFERTAL